MNTTYNIKSIFIDIDGTLINTQLELPEENRKALERCNAENISIVLVTGRPYASVKTIHQQLNFISYCIVSNGGVLFDMTKDSATTFNDFTKEAVNEYIQLANNNNIATCMYSPKEWFALEQNALIQIEIDRSSSNPIIIQSIEEIQTPIIKLLFIGFGENMKKFEIELNMAYDFESKPFYSYPEYYELMPNKVSKGIAVKHLLSNILGTSGQSLAIGDGTGDIPMFTECNLKAAVANASKEVLIISNFIGPSNDENGVAHIINGLVFGDKASLEKLKIQNPPTV